MKKLSFMVILFILGFATIIVGMTALHNLDVKQSTNKVEAIKEKYDITVVPYQEVRCLNGWLIITAATGGRMDSSWIYARDENFDPIPCDKE